ncbi:MAG: hypothetical protein J5I62_02140 [Flavobacteriales bacterium]|nr:hypothetical protein [Flavobacteriales bacterium]MEB2340819.1 hypothetical protein [Flavobacteriia bacterium]
MIVHLLHHQIDRAAWDRRLAASANAAWYGTAAALDAAAPGWNALVDDSTGSQMPLTWRRKYGIAYLFQPIMVQHLGPYSPSPAPAEARRFLQALPKLYRYADICLLGDTPGPLLGIHQEIRMNHVLDLGGTAAAIRSGYSTNHRRNLRKLENSGSRVERQVDAGVVLAFIEGSGQLARWHLDAGRKATMGRIMKATEGQGTGFGRMVIGAQGPLAAGWFVRGPREVVFLKGISNAQGRGLGAMHALIDDVITEFAASGSILDLAGGNDPQLARFYAGFGARPVPYFRALMNRLPPVIRYLKP